MDDSGIVAQPRRIGVVRVPFALLVCLVAVAPGCTDREPLKVSVAPDAGLVDEPFDVRVTGASPSASVTITVTGTSRSGATWSSTRDARADDAGGVFLPDEYLLAQLRPPSGAPEDDSLTPPFELEVAAQEGDERDVTTVRRVLRPEAVELAELRVVDDGFRARWWMPKDDARRTAILLLGGSNGGLASELQAAVLAGHGYHVLQLAYFSEEGLPAELLRIPLEYFRTALEWLRGRGEIDPDRLVAFGVSRGGELALLLGSTYPELVHAVVGYVPSSLVVPAITDPNEPAWTLGGKPLPSTTIELERITGPVFAVGGELDALWPSGVSAQLIGQRLDAAGRRDYVALSYPRAGHGVGIAVPNTWTPTTVSTRYGDLDFGGSPSADEAAREDSWPKLLRFLDGVEGGP